MSDGFRSLSLSGERREEGREEEMEWRDGEESGGEGGRGREERRRRGDGEGGTGEEEGGEERGRRGGRRGEGDGRDGGVRRDECEETGGTRQEGGRQKISFLFLTKLCYSLFVAVT
ncbi:hypothetical protein Tco_0622843 [Tanacetum coccineum]